jgi:hypothetical protein
MNFFEQPLVFSFNSLVFIFKPLSFSVRGGLYEWINGQVEAHFFCTCGGKQEHNTPLSDLSPAAAAEPATSRHLHPGHLQLDSAEIYEKKAHEHAK